MRKVKVYEWVNTVRIGQPMKKFLYTGVFHAWGLDVQEYDMSVGTYSTAIIELQDGTVVNVPVELIQFVDEVTH